MEHESYFLSSSRQQTARRTDKQGAARHLLGQAIKYAEVRRVVGEAVDRAI
jgi:hypothetical protein